MESDIMQEDMLEHLSQLLIRGEVPHLFDHSKAKTVDASLNKIEISREEILHKMIDKEKENDHTNSTSSS